MSDDSAKPGNLDRRTFLKTAAAAGAGLAATGVAGPVQGADDAATARGAETGAAKPKAAKALPGDIVIARPGSDFMCDVIKSLGIDYVIANPGTSFRGLHESLINYLQNRSRHS